MTVEEEAGVTTPSAAIARRSFLGKAGLGVAGFAASSALIAACGSSAEEGGGDDDEGGDDDAESVQLTQDAPDIEWEMGTSWPTSLVTLFGAAETFAEQVSLLTDGKFKINARPAGEIVGGLEVLPTVRDGGMEMGHTRQPPSAGSGR